MSFLCRLGFHDTWNDTHGLNFGSAATPVYVMVTTIRCRRCDWNERHRYSR